MEALVASVFITDDELFFLSERRSDDDVFFSFHSERAALAFLVGGQSRDTQLKVFFVQDVKP